MAETMTAVRFHEFGDTSVLQTETVPRPVAGAGEILVRVQATSVNPIDTKIRQGLFQQFMPVALPFTPGGDIAGTVEAVGAGVTGFAPGDAVFGILPPNQGGAYAQYAVVTTDRVAHKPQSLSFVEAASVPVVALTAWEALFGIAHLSAGQSVLVHGGAGGVGLFAVQFAKQTGANPIYATASAGDREFVQSLGATQVIDYKNERFEDVVKNVDVVLDLIGGETQARSWGVLKPGGTLVATTQPPSAEKAQERGVRVGMVEVKPTQETLTQITSLLQSGAVKTFIGATFLLTDARAAHEQSHNGHTRGKIALTVA